VTGNAGPFILPPLQEDECSTWVFVLAVGIDPVQQRDRTVKTKLPRKEVIQPQLPLRLPCYDFVPITRPTLGAKRLQVLPAFMT
jgi:hypothetical protein